MSPAGSRVLLIGLPCPEVFKAAFASEACEVFEAQTCIQAIRLFAEQMPDAIVTQPFTPLDRDGVAARRHCRSRQSAIPILFVTGYGTDDLEQFDFDPTL